MYPDEQRPEQELRQQYMDYRLSDPSDLFLDYEELRSRNHELELKIAEFGGNSASTRHSPDRAAWEAERQDLLRKLGEAHGALKIYREGYWKQREEISELRNSRSMRIGRAITSPYQRLRALGKVNDTKEERLGATEGHTQSAPRPAAVVKQENTPSKIDPKSAIEGDANSRPKNNKERTTTVKKTPKVIESKSSCNEQSLDCNSLLPIGQRSFEQLKFEFEQDPVSIRLKRVLTRAWYAHGKVDEPAELIADNPSLVAQLTKQDQQLVNQILAAKRVKGKATALPPRSRGASYLLEPGRVMYCVHSTPVFNSNGYSIRTKGVAEGLKEAGQDIHVVARPGYPWDTTTDTPTPESRRHRQVINDVPYIHNPGMSLNSAPLDHYIQFAADAYVREARRLRPQLIQAASNHLTALPALIAARRLGVPFIYEVRGFWELTGISNNPEWETSDRYKLAVDLETFVATEADHVLAITQEVANKLINRGVVVGKISLAPNAVDPKSLVPLPKDTWYAAKRKIRTDVPTIGFAGSIVPYEGLETLLKASQQLVERGVDHQVVIAGAGESVQSLKAMRDDLKAWPVTFIGRVPNAEIPRLLSTFDIMPCPRVSEKVTELVSPLKPLEAFSASKAVVLSDVSPHKSLAGFEEERALLFKAGDAVDLANTLQRLIQDKNLSKELGRAGRLWTISERNWTALGLKIAATYQQAVEDHQALQPASSRPLSKVKLGVIADEFTTVTLAGSCQVIPLNNANWRQQLAEHKFDAIFIESAWAGNENQWFRCVGNYSLEESKNLFQLLEVAREKHIPSIFWNKEDPVHIERFIKTASKCDHIFTTDANMIPRYLAEASLHTKTVASLPFYAEPKIHNPLPRKRPYEHTVAYAGTYYGDRYTTRSRQLHRLLVAAKPHGLTIYDRQMQFENSPYQFPAEFREHVRGALPYAEVLDQYKSHLVQLNVNSVTDSPTMYSRRVVEIAASGGLVLSGPGRGIEESLGNTILASSEPSVWRAALHDWAAHPESNLRESWRQMRTVLRSHTTTTALSMAFRSAGIPVDGLMLDTYAVKLLCSSEDTVKSLAAQSVLPKAVIVSKSEGDLLPVLKAKGIQIITDSELDQVDATWIGEIDAPIFRTHFEDLLSATLYGSWKTIRYQVDAYRFGTDIARTMREPSKEAEGELLVGLDRHNAFEGNESDETVLLQFAGGQPQQQILNVPKVSAVSNKKSRTTKNILFAGHDLKFATPLMEHLGSQGYTILVDKWDDHNRHDKEASLKLLAKAEMVFCEWGLGNAVWYSQNVSRHQRLVVRVHSQELRREYLSKISHSNVDSYIFVGELVRLAAVESHGVPNDKTCVIPNAVDVQQLALPKTKDAKFNLGLVGIVPSAKRLDLALDIIERVRSQDDRYRLFIKGKQPQDYPWLMRIPSEMEYYTDQYARIDKINDHSPGAIVFDPFGNDMPEWYQKIGSVLSVSDFESFHLTLADGAASGAMAFSLLWPGSDMVYPYDWLYSSVESIATDILTQNGQKRDPASVQRVLVSFGAQNVYSRLENIILYGR